jgi:hypothetical protein
MFHVCIGLGPRLSPKRALGKHLGIVLPAASLFCNAKTGQAKVWLCAIFEPTRIKLKSSSRDDPSSNVGKMLCISAALCSAYGHRAVCTATGHRWRACNSCFRALSERSLMARLAIPFWKCTLTPQKVSCCLLCWHACWNALSANQPLSQW